MKKKILMLLLTMVMGITCMLPADTYASEIDAQSEIQETLENFFEALLGTLSEHSAKDYDSNDFQGIDGYYDLISYKALPDDHIWQGRYGGGLGTA